LAARNGCGAPARTVRRSGLRPRLPEGTRRLRALDHRGPGTVPDLAGGAALRRGEGSGPPLGPAERGGPSGASLSGGWVSSNLDGTAPFLGFLIFCAEVIHAEVIASVADGVSPTRACQPRPGR